MMQNSTKNGIVKKIIHSALKRLSMLEIKKIELTHVKNNCLKERMERASSGISSEYIAFMDGIEVGVLSLEHWAKISSAFIYEIYVLPDYRRRGIGEKLLTFAEEEAIQLHCDHIKLEPNNFDKTVELEKLIYWYEKNGYKKTTKYDGHWIKNLNKPLRG
ncbi:GNAT family N-acetyltransferase [Proteus vulgaris]|nr:GNAT family N-acetyltransferase [Proteus vulgaris]MBW3474121.1 GNAT family N-acetyltransferase [Proteus vulgaris]